MQASNIQRLTDEVRMALSEVATVIDERDMLKRVLIQATLSAPDQALRVDVTRSDEAKSGNWILDIGGGVLIPDIEEVQNTSGIASKTHQGAQAL